MKFIDEAVITVQSGDGGRGCVRDVILKTTSRKRTLYQFRYKKHFNAKKGAHGQGKKKTGKNGQNLVIELPPGTLVTDANTGSVIKDLVKTNETFVIAIGGRGGQGNTRFKTSTNRAPRFAQPGEPGETITLKLDLKLLADVGIIGLPNAGKSTLIRAISSARPKIGNYPFTTITPSLGVVQTDWTEPFVVADIPGLIEGAHKGTGLGIKFLRHIERTRILVHLIDIATIDLDNPLQAYNIINQELALYNSELAQKPQIIVLNKIDLPHIRKAAEIFQSAVKDRKIGLISALTGKGVEELKRQIVHVLNQSYEE
ncbi:MAG: GTPase ObgE [Deltaproteobacteria bacterium]|nr:GTPase ObgE [Deltaproteobacteria bacterium]